ncbi:uncharacterized protein [Amphiura filiformis]|uniref:uncharacterized protein n=1 Tax=Amphiura filiformis TaxID=82378 RepID=UPI003B2148D0
MAYVYGNALNVSIALIVFGLVQIAMFVSCYFGCRAEFLFDFAAPAWSGLFAVLTGLFGVCMVRTVKEFKVGGLFLFLCLSSILCSLACLAITAAISFWIEFDLTMDDNNNGEITNGDGATPGSGDAEKDEDTIVLTGLLIEGAVVLFGLILLICSCYGAWLNCCCESRPPKGYLNSNMEHVYMSDADTNGHDRKNNVRQADV